MKDIPVGGKYIPPGALIEHVSNDEATGMQALFELHGHWLWSVFDDHSFRLKPTLIVFREKFNLGTGYIVYTGESRDELLEMARKHFPLPPR